MKSMRYFNLFVIALFLFALVPVQSVFAAPSQAVLPPPYLTAPAVSVLPAADGWQPTLKWKAVAGASTYDVQIATSTSYSNIVYSATLISSAVSPVEHKVGTDLPANKKLYWRARTVNADGAGKWSSSRIFYTRPHPVVAGFVNGPMALANDTVASLRPTFEWEKSENVTKYTLHIATTDTFSSIKVNKTFNVAAAMNPITYTLTSDLAAGTTYYWRVQALGTYAKSPYSTTQTFATPTAPPKVPVLVSPLNTTVKVYNPDLTWGVVPADPGRTVHYQVQLSTSSKFTVIAKEYLDIATATFTIPEQLTAGKYYWHVRSIDDRGVLSNWSKAYYFNTPATVVVRVIDAAIYSTGTLEGLEGITVRYAGVVDPMLTDADGYVTIRFAPTGSRKISLSADDFLNYAKTQSISNGKLYNLTYQLKRRPMRIDLTWGKLPSDLDVHLWLPQAYYEYHLYPDHKGSTTKLPWAKIDKDAYGTATTKAERMTIQNRFPGVYNFGVFNMSRNGNWENSSAKIVISKLDATGKVWQPVGLPITVVKPGGTYNGKWWHVFNLDGATGLITEINTVQLDAPGPYDQFGGTAIESK